MKAQKLKDWLDLFPDDADIKYEVEKSKERYLARDKVYLYGVVEGDNSTKPMLDLSEEEETNAEDRLEQVANLLVSWKTQLVERDLAFGGRDHICYQKFELCARELESVLAGKPLL